MNESKDSTLRVWDPIVRIGHWTLVTTFFIAYFTEDDLITAHVWAGYVLGAVVLFRLLWGFIGSKHARFGDFVKAPGTVVAYLKSLRKGQAERYVGHNPAGGIMILLLLFCLSVTVYTGLELYAIEDNAGPLAGLDSQAAGSAVMGALVSPVYAGDDDSSDDDDDDSGVNGQRHSNPDMDEDAEEFWEELHELFANLTLLLVFLHVTGVVISSRLHGENLVKAMLTGKKLRQ